MYRCKSLSVKRENNACNQQKYLRQAVVGLLFILLCCGASAITTQSFQASATIIPGCLVQGNSNGILGTLNFGTYPGTTNAAVTTSFVQTTALTLACTPGVLLSMKIDGGTHYTTARHLMQNGYSAQLPYRLYTDSSHSTANEIQVNQSVPLPYSDSNNITLPIYGVLQLTGVNPAGHYTDILTVTLSW